MYVVDKASTHLGRIRQEVKKTKKQNCKGLSMLNLPMVLLMLNPPMGPGNLCCFTSRSKQPRKKEEGGEMGLFEDFKNHVHPR